MTRELDLKHMISNGFMKCRWWTGVPQFKKKRLYVAKSMAERWVWGSEGGETRGTVDTLPPRDPINWVCLHVLGRKKKKHGREKKQLHESEWMYPISKLDPFLGWDDLEPGKLQWLVFFCPALWFSPLPGKYTWMTRHEIAKICHCGQENFRTSATWAELASTTWMKAGVCRSLGVAEISCRMSTDGKVCVCEKIPQTQTQFILDIDFIRWSCIILTILMYIDMWYTNIYKA